MEGSVISQIATLHLQSKTRLLTSACCPDKDLVVLISRHGNVDKMSLWKMQGSKKWEVDVSRGGGGIEEITAISWSPDGQTIVVAHHPPRVSLHSIQNGSEERSLSVRITASSSTSAPRITGVWWFKSGRKPTRNSLPYMFKRGHTITGSAHAVLRMQPLLDALQDITQPVTANDLFAFQGTPTAPTSQSSSLPDVISSWPALPPDLLAASIQVPREGDNARLGAELDEIDQSNVDSFLTVTDSTGQIHCFLDGSYSCGAVRLGAGCVATSLIKDSTARTLYVTAEHTDSDVARYSNLLPIAVHIPLLDQRLARQVAESCSSARELVWYAMRTIKEMRQVWFGGDGIEGAREVNPNFVRALHERQTQFGQQEPNAVLDITCFLTTGRASEGLLNFIVVGEQFTERGMKKWENSVSDPLIKLRSFSEKRLAPALQRLHLVLEEVKGWSLLAHQYTQFEFSTQELTACLDLAARGIVIAAWLAATARRELLRFRDFISFLSSETSRFHSRSPEARDLTLRHDYLEVNSYLMTGLVVSPIDKWFIGPVPQFAPEELSASPVTQGLSSVLEHARRVASDPSQVVWPPNTHSRDLSHLDRNLDALIQALAERCGQIFDRASKAVARTANLDPQWHMPGACLSGNLGNETATKHVVVRERTVCDENESGSLTQHVAVCIPEDREGVVNRELLCMIRSTYRHEGAGNIQCKVSIALLECGIRSEEGQAWLNVPDEELLDEFSVLDLDFFDEQHLVMVYRTPPIEGPVIAMVDYRDLGYQEVDVRGYVNGPSREDVVSEGMKQRKAGQLGSVPVPIKKRRVLPAEWEGRPSLCVNGRSGRRVACVLDSTGLELEVLDMEGEEEAEEEEEER